ncbi:uncharacterized protein B0J16DRAFT_379744 [Fusarium flagelliforme]|uniref:Uncharacterized protein n=1 Tax=Fusarium flagelliforme TaxID=2675880 RepID=A0A395MCC5_9HYPO|nr:uncharacterized protein B0J16DRAFT_379744 [Fusarium flagelliforme]KAH7191856.1 hypothetical protein B0J16DRAFT_379744 [Fusarium flagelliforme]RFN45515.1 hypothetical protein FIE12Z_10278 [Fusarium flagelliforme]
MSQQDSESNSDGSISPTSSTSENPWPIFGRDCHHLGHLEAIPIKRSGNLKLIFKGSIEPVDEEWGICNANYHGPCTDICFKIPGPGNNWIAALVEHGSMDELVEIVQAHDTKGYKYHWYTRFDHYRTKPVQEVIVESYSEGDKRERVPEGPGMIATLAERITGFAALVAP